MEHLAGYLKEVWPFLASIGAIILSVFAKKIANFIILIFRMLVVWLRKRFQLHLSCPVPGIKDALDQIQKELRPNGGSSLRDAVNNTKTTVENVDKKVTGLSSKLAAMQVSHDIISDTLNICRWAADSNGHINFINNPLRNLLGSVDDSLYGDGWTNIVVKEDRLAAISEWERCVESQIEYNDTYRVKNQQTGEIIKITSHARVSRSFNSGHVEGWIGVVIPHEKL